MPSDWKPRATKKNRRLLRKLHLERGECVLADRECSNRIELHHLLGGAYGREDHTSNIVRLCSVHHEQITRNDIEARMALGEHIRLHRRDIILYMCDRLGSVSGDDWLRRRLFIEE